MFDLSGQLALAYVRKKLRNLDWKWLHELCHWWRHRYPDVRVTKIWNHLSWTTLVPMYIEYPQRSRIASHNHHNHRHHTYAFSNLPWHLEPILSPSYYAYYIHNSDGVNRDSGKIFQMVAFIHAATPNPSATTYEPTKRRWDYKTGASSRWSSK